MPPLERFADESPRTARASLSLTRARSSRAGSRRGAVDRDVRRAAGVRLCLCTCRMHAAVRDWLYELRCVNRTQQALVHSNPDDGVTAHTPHTPPAHVSRVEATLQTVASRHQSPSETHCSALRYRHSRRGTRGHRPAELPGLLLGSLCCRCLAAQEGAEVSGARGIYRRLRVVEHGCCGRRANLVSVEFVKRSAGERTAMNSRHKPRPRGDK